MVYAWVLRHQVVGGKNYYFIFDTVEAMPIKDDVIHITKGSKTEGENVASYAKGRNAFYLLIDYDNYKNTLNCNIPILLKESEEDNIEVDIKETENEKNIEKPVKKLNLIQVFDQEEYNYVLSVFYLIYHDFYVNFPIDIKDIITNIEDMVKSNVIGQDNVADKIIKKIHNNLMFFQSDLTVDEMYKHKNNILLVGPRGTGKTSIVENIAKGCHDVPIISYTLTGNYEEDICNIFKKLFFASNKNIFLAEQGVVIFDGIDERQARIIQNEDGIDIINDYLIELYKIMSSREIILNPANNTSPIKFDFSLITNICVVDMDYDFEFNFESIDGLFYTKIRESKFYSYGFTDSILLDCFDDEIIFMNPMTYDLAREILTSVISPLYRVKRTIENEFETKVYFSKKFLDRLIEIGLNLGEGFLGIERVVKYVVDNKDITSDKVYFKVTDFDDLKIGSNVIAELNGELPNNIYKKEIKNNSKDPFNVDLTKKTINGMTVLEVVNKIKEKVVGQDDQVFEIVDAFFNHVLNRHKGFTDEEYRELKQNVLVIGSTGVGKTTIFEQLAKIFDVPYLRESIKGYTPTGFYGPDLDTILRSLIRKSNGNTERAKYGILGLDEFDKLANTIGTSDGIRFGKEVQEELLTLMEGDIRHVKMSENSNISNVIDFDTSNLFVVLMGAFQGLDKISNKRAGMKTAGFKTSETLKVDIKPNKKDVVEYGVVDQLASRVPHVISLNDLNEEVLFKIINNRNSYVSLSLRSFSKVGVKVRMTDSFARGLAKRAAEAKEGARGIKNIFEEIVTEIDRNNQSGDIEEVTLDEDAVHDYSKISYVKKIGSK